MDVIRELLKAVALIPAGFIIALALMFLEDAVEIRVKNGYNLKMGLALMAMGVAAITALFML